MGAESADNAVILPQFPLGSVLFPSMALGLQVFEPRYRQLLDDINYEGGEFGVVLISRGSEAGGGDQRFDVGCRARIVACEAMGDGQYRLVAAGVDRYRVRRWLPDDPYPKAEIEPWPDPPEDEGRTSWAQQVASVVEQLEACLHRSGVAGGFDESLVDGPDLGPITMALATLSPVGPLDKHRLLSAAGARERLDLLDQLLAETLEVLDFLGRDEG